MGLKRLIAYAYSWRRTWYIGLILGFLLAAILIVLQPFDTYGAAMPYKNLRLAGYALCMLLPIIILHPLENYWYDQLGRRWQVWNEVVVMTLELTLVIICCYFYNTYLVNGSHPSWQSGWYFFTHFGLPLALFLLPLWLYLRFYFGKVEVQEQERGADLLTIKGENIEDEVVLTFSDFIMAQAQQNYVDLYYLDPGKEIQKKVIRSTLANLLDQLPGAYRVHRSYLVNLDQVRSVKGNARKRFLEIGRLEEAIPVSQKYYEAIRDHLQIHPIKD